MKKQLSFLAILVVALSTIGCSTSKNLASIPQSSNSSSQAFSSEVLPTEINVSETSLTLCVGDTYTLAATVFPEDADNRIVTWSSSNTSVAEVYNGVIYTNAAGIATIIASTVNNLQAICRLTVKDKITIVATVGNYSNRYSSYTTSYKLNSISIDEITESSNKISVSFNASITGVSDPQGTEEYLIYAKITDKDGNVIKNQYSIFHYYYLNVGQTYSGTSKNGPHSFDKSLAPLTFTVVSYDSAKAN